MDRYAFIGVFDAKNANPNGDPSANGAPRSPYGDKGLVTSVSLKFKIRRYVEHTMAGVPGYEIFIRRGTPKNALLRQAYQALGLKLDQGKDVKPEELDVVQKWLCQNYFDIRAFGGVLNTGENRSRSLPGAVQIFDAESVDKVEIINLKLSCAAVTREDANAEFGTFGVKYIIRYGLYVFCGVVNPWNNPYLTEKDLEILWEAMGNMFDFTASTTRGEITMRKLYVARSLSKYGSAHTQCGLLKDLLDIRKKPGVISPHKYSDYEVIFHREKLPPNVEFTALLDF